MPDATGFVGELYGTMLGRRPSAPEAASQVAVLSAGATRDAVVDGVVRSTEYLGLQVENAFTSLLGRQVDAASKSSAVAFLSQTENGINTVLRGILGSAEYTAAHPGADAFVESLYESVLGRDSDAAGKASFIANLNAGRSAADVAGAFLASAERVGIEVESLYLEVLHRTADDTGRGNAVAGVVGGGSLNTVLRNLFTSTEFQSRREPDSTDRSRSPRSANLPVLDANAPFDEATFIDPTVTLISPANMTLGKKVYVGTFATLDASAGTISIGDGSNVQDNVSITAGPGGVVIGDSVILAHGVTVQGNARIGEAGGEPVFLSFNSFIDGATLEPDTIVMALGRVGPGVVLHSGMAVLPGKFVQTQAEADDPSLGKVTLVTAEDHEFIEDVLHVNTSLAKGYARLYLEQGFAALLGVSRDPGGSDFNPVSDTPTFAGVGRTSPLFRNRIIGQVDLADSLEQLDAVTGNADVIRVDEGEPFEFGTIAGLGDRFTAHALEFCELQVGNNFRAGFHSVLHAGEDDGNADPTERTVVGDNVTMADWSVVFRSTIGAGSTIGFRALVDGSQLAPNTVVPDRAIIVNNVLVGTVEW